MVICIDLSQRTKDELDRLVETGGYRSYSDAVSIAVANQLLLQTHAFSGTLKLDHFAGGSTPESAADSSAITQPSKIPSLFSLLDSEIRASRFGSYPDDRFDVGANVSVDRWIFGQHNKLLPVKATCRALARLMTSEAQPNLAVARTASEIASEAVKLGDCLRHIDEISGVHRDEALSFAFPFSKSPNGDKSRLRFANQFVASFTKQGTLTGLPFELKLLNRDQSRTPQILLTEAGWFFAAMRNPILDDGKDGRQARFSNEEIDFLLSHIGSRVPAEAFAFHLVLDAIAKGANTPDDLDDALAEYVPVRKDKPFTRAFVTTQRAGVISRMVDLGLVARIRDGINVSYSANATKFEFSPNTFREAIQN